MGQEPSDASKQTVARTRQTLLEYTSLLHGHTGQVGRWIVFMVIAAIGDVSRAKALDWLIDDALPGWKPLISQLEGRPPFAVVTSRVMLYALGCLLGWQILKEVGEWAMRRGIRLRESLAETIAAEVRRDLRLNTNQLPTRTLEGVTDGEQGALLGHVSKVQETISVSLSELGACIVKLGVSLAVAIWLDRRSVFLLLILVPSLVIYTWSKRDKAAAGRRASEAKDAVVENWAMVTDPVDVQQARAQGATPWLEQISDGLDATRVKRADELVKAKLREIAAWNGTYNFLGACPMILIPFGLPTGSLVGLLYLQGPLLLAVFGIIRSLTDIEAAAEGIRRVNEARNRKTEDHGDLDPRPGPLHVRDVTVTRHLDSGKVRIAGVSLVFEPGEKVAVLGKSGSGKSTLLRAICGDLPPDRGEVTQGGVPVSQANLWAWRSRLIYGHQVARPKWGGTVSGVIAYGRPYEQWQIEEAARGTYVHHVVMGMPDGYDEQVGENSGFSGGELARILLARLAVGVRYPLPHPDPLHPPIGRLSGFPEVLCLDEPTAHLDSDETAPELFAAFEPLVERVPIVVVATNGLIPPWTTRVIRMEGCRIVGDESL